MDLYRVHDELRLPVPINSGPPSVTYPHPLDVPNSGHCRASCPPYSRLRSMPRNECGWLLRLGELGQRCLNTVHIVFFDGLLGLGELLVKEGRVDLAVDACPLRLERHLVLGDIVVLLTWLGKRIS